MPCAKAAGNGPTPLKGEDLTPAQPRRAMARRRHSEPPQQLRRADSPMLSLLHLELPLEDVKIQAVKQRKTSVSICRYCRLNICLICCSGRCVVLPAA